MAKLTFWFYSYVQMVEMVLDSIRVYKEFAYTKWPTEEHYAVLDQARHALLSTYASQKWKLTPTTYFMNSHAIEFAVEDGTGYFTLQEGVEIEHCGDKLDLDHTFKGNQIDGIGKTRWQQILDHQELKHILYGKAPRRKMPVPIKYYCLSRRPPIDRAQWPPSLSHTIMA